jgi:ABC-type bacteriocin/lantibiotic exporter with double-glycine peptidase domain
VTGRALLAREVIQTSAMDCGPAALKSLLEGFGIPISYGRLREACRTEVDGTSIDTLEDLAVELGLEAEQVMLPVDHVVLPSSRSLPSIAVVRLPNGFTHFVVLWRRHGNLVQVMDPARGRRWITLGDLASELYRHTMPVPAGQFRDYAGSSEFLEGLRARLDELRVSSSVRDAQIERASADPEWHSLAALDAATRMAHSLVGAKAIARGREASELVESFATKGARDPSVIPREYWSAFEGEGDDVLLRGAVMVRVLSARRLDLDHSELPRELVAALREKPRHPLASLAGALREDGWFSPASLLFALALGAIGVVVEALLFRGALEAPDLLRIPNQAIAVGVCIAVFVLALLLLQVPAAALTARIGRRLEARVRMALLRKMPLLADAYFRSRPTSDMAQRAHAIHAVRTLPSIGATLVQSVVVLAASTAGMMWLDPAHAPWIALAAVLSIAVPAAFVPFAGELDLRVQTHFGALSRFYLDALLGLVPVRAHRAERTVEREHEALLVEWERASSSSARATVALEVAVVGTGIASVVWLVHAYLGSGRPIASVLLLAYWALRVPALGLVISQQAQRYARVRNALARVLEPLGALEEESVEPTGDRSGAAAIRFEEVVVRSGGNTILDGVSLTIEPGSKVAIVGASGSGKSTLVGLLLGWHRASAGTIRVDDVALDARALADLRRSTAWVDPAVRLWNRSLLENLRYGNASEAALGRVVDEAMLGELVGMLPEGLATPLGEGGALVSGGEGDRVRLGRALLRSDVRLAIFDEPFGGLDSGARERLLRAALDRFGGATFLCVTHDLLELHSMDRVIVLDHGRIVEDGAPADLAADPASHFAKMRASAESMRSRLSSASGFRRVRIDRGTLSEDDER